MEKIKDCLCNWLCWRWCERKGIEAAKRAWKAGYNIGYEDGKEGREKNPPPPFGFWGKQRSNRER
jgi:hypothetical protein